MAGLGWLDSRSVPSRSAAQLRIDGGLGLVRLYATLGALNGPLRIDGGLGLVRLSWVDRAWHSPLRIDGGLGLVRLSALAVSKVRPVAD